MKTALFSTGALALGLLAARPAAAQNNVVKIDIFQPIINTLALAYEHKLSESSSFQLGVSVTSRYKEDGYSFGNYGGDQRRTSGFSLMPEYRFYLSEKHPALEGFYVAPFLRYQHLSQSGRYGQMLPNGNVAQKDLDATLNAFGGGVVVGRHWIFKQRFSLDALLGPSYMSSSVTSNEPNIERGDFVGYYDNMNYGLRGAVTFGLAF